MNEPYVLMVGRDAPHELEIALRGTMKVKRCAGSGSRSCPALQGGRCELRADARAAIVYLAGEHEFHSTAEWQCVASAPSPGIAVLEGTLHPAHARNGFAVVGSALGPAEVVATLARVLEDPAGTDAARDDRR